MIRLLLVEDNEMNRDMLSRRLQRKGFEVLIAVDGEEAVNKALHESVDLILMDMNLPIMDGWQATQAIRLREQEMGKHTPIIAVTAHAMSRDHEKSLNAGCDDYAPKPVRLDELIEQINRLLDMRQNNE